MILEEVQPISQPNVMNKRESKPIPKLKTQEIQRSTRSHHEPQRYGFLETPNNDVMIIHDDEPTSYQEAMASLDFKKWLEAMKYEIHDR